MVEPASATEKSEAYKATNADFSAFNRETEEPMELENWMTDEHIFHSLLNIETETEAPLVLETWMTNDSTFKTNNFVIEEEKEEALELESWMTSNKIW